MRMAMSFPGTIERWFLNLTANSISRYGMFKQKFLEEWGNEYNDMELLNQTSPSSDPMAEIFTDINSGEDPFHPVFIDKVKISSNSDEDETCNQLVEDSFHHSPQIDRFSFEVFLQEKLTKFPSIRREVMAYLLNHPSVSQDDILKNVQRIISSASCSKIVSEEPGLISDSSNQDCMILDENPGSSICAEFIEDALEMKFDDCSMVESHIIKDQISIMPISSSDRSLNTYEELTHILPEFDEVSFPNQNPLALCNSEDGQPRPKPCNVSFDHFLLSHDE